jgi:alanine racemase
LASALPPPRKRVEVDAAAITANTAALKRHIGPGVELMAMVKSNGYGHGLGNAAAAAVAGGATWLGVASTTEAFEACAFGVPVLVVGRADPGSEEALAGAGIHTTVFDADGVAATADAAARSGRRAAVHLKVDTGMGRLGVRPHELTPLLELLDEQEQHIEIAGVFTNFADSDGADLAFTEEQHARFDDVIRSVRLVAPAARAHCSNSAALLRAPHMHHDLVRPGLALYGYPPAVAPDVVALRPAMTALAPVTQVKTVTAGTPVGYGRTWTAPRETRVATVAAGYADGVLRALSNTGTVLVGGCRCPIVGRVSMDQLCVDVGGVDTRVRPGDDAVLFGEQGSARLGADEVAAAAGTIEREILTAVPDRIPRVVNTERGRTATAGDKTP